MVRGLVQYFSMMFLALDLRLHYFPALTRVSDHITVAMAKMLLLFAKYYVSYCTVLGNTHGIF